MFLSLAILYLTITDTGVSFLTPVFCYSSIACQDAEHSYNYGNTYLATGHNYNFDTTNKECVITISGSGYIFPSWKDTVSISF